MLSGFARLSTITSVFSSVAAVRALTTAAEHNLFLLPIRVELP
jgi:hypothetical protein